MMSVAGQDQEWVDRRRVDHWQAALTRARASLDAGRPREAVPQLESLIDDCVRHRSLAAPGWLPGLQRLLAEAYFLSGEDRRCIRHLKQALSGFHRLHDREALRECAATLAAVHRDLGDADEAATWAEWIERLKPAPDWLPSELLVVPPGIDLGSLRPVVEGWDLVEAIEDQVCWRIGPDRAELSLLADPPPDPPPVAAHLAEHRRRWQHHAELGGGCMLGCDLHDLDGVPVLVVQSQLARADERPQAWAMLRLDARCAQLVLRLECPATDDSAAAMDEAQSRCRRLLARQLLDARVADPVREAMAEAGLIARPTPVPMVDDD